ncbi:MAG: hypothetical protein ACREO0_00190 [Pseudoxanthomonas sp.]
MNQPVEPADTPRIDPVEVAIASKTATDAAPQAAPSVVVRLLGVLKREPVLFITLAYLFVSFLGLWSSFWFYRRFEVPILDYMQSSDFFVAGLRRPQFMLLLGISLFWLWLSAWPVRWVERNRERAEDYKRRYWWGKYLFPDPKSWQGLGGMRSETMLVVAFLGLALHVVYTFSMVSAKDILRDKDKTHRVRVTLSVEGAPSAEASLLGTTSAFVLLWRADTQRAEVVPIESIAKIESLDKPQLPTKSSTAPANKAAP